MNRLLATIEIFRPHNMIAAAGCVFCGYFLSGGRTGGDIVLALILTALVTGLGNLINDYFDVDIDCVNKPKRPLPSGRLGATYVVRVYGVGTLVVTALVVGFAHGALALWLLLLQALLYFYARKAKRVALLGNVLISTVAASAFVVGASLTGSYWDVMFAAALAFLLVMGREMVKGAEDVEGDRSHGAQTLAVRFGVERTATIAATVLFLCAVTAPLPGLAQVYGRYYSLLMGLVFVPGVLVAAVIVAHSPERAVFNRASWILKIEMFFGIIAMTLGRV